MIFRSPHKPVAESTVLFHEKVLSALQRHCINAPEKLALVSAENPEKCLKFDDLMASILSVSSFLTKEGFGYRDVICLVLPTSIEYIIGFLAALNCGGIVTGISAISTSFEIERHIRDSQPTAVIATGQNLSNVLEAVKNCPLKTIICLDPEIPLPPNILLWSDAISCPIAPIPSHPTKLDDVAFLPYSSGTTGMPKGVMITHKAFGMSADIMINNNRLATSKFAINWNHYDKFSLQCLPFYHLYGFLIVNTVLIEGSTAVIMSKFDPLLFFKCIQDYKIESLMIVPPQALVMLRHEAANQYDMSSLKCILTAAAPLGKELCEEFHGKFKNLQYVVQAYGMTETGGACHLPMYEKNDSHASVGHIAPNFEMKVVDPFTGRELSSNERGEICVRGPATMKGYFNRPKETSEVLQSDGWLHTGDIGYVNEKGETFIVDRIKELIKVKGFQVAPAELEDILLGHPGIADCAVVGVPDEKTGEKPKAFIVRKINSLSEEEVEKYIKEKVSSYKWLAGGVEFIKEIPKNPTGKILRKLLRKSETQG